MALQVHELDGYPAYLPDDVRRFLASPGALSAWVAEEDGAVLGHVALHSRSSEAALALACESLGQSPERLGVVARLLVAPSARKRGIGGMLLDTATQAALRRGLHPILDVVTKHIEAINLYEHSGWTRLGQVTARFSDGHELDEIVFAYHPR